MTSSITLGFIITFNKTILTIINFGLSNFYFYILNNALMSLTSAPYLLECWYLKPGTSLNSNVFGSFPLMGFHLKTVEWRQAHQEIGTVWFMENTNYKYSSWEFVKSFQVYLDHQQKRKVGKCVRADYFETKISKWNFTIVKILVFNPLDTMQETDPWIILLAKKTNYFFHQQLPTIAWKNLTKPKSQYKYSKHK